MKDSMQEGFLKANSCYHQQDYAHALNVYERIPHKSAAIWYNMGNCAYKNGDDLKALLYWKRAEKLGSAAIVADSALNTATLMKKMGLPPQKNNSLWAISPLAVQILFFLIFSVFLVSNRWLWRAKRFLLLVLLSALVIATGVFTYYSFVHATQAYGLIMSEENIVYAGPNTGYHQIVTIPKGTIISVLAHKHGWKKITWSNHIGWIQDEKIEVI